MKIRDTHNHQKNKTTRAVKFNENFARPTSFDGQFATPIVQCTCIEQGFFYRATLKFLIEIPVSECKQKHVHEQGE